MATFFTADEHIGHLNVIKFCNRPFTDLEHMHEEIIYRHNSRVTDQDEVYHIGDMFWRTFGTSNAIEYMERLNGIHLYVYGNHEEVFDHPGRTMTLQQCFAGLYERKQIFPEGGPRKGIVLDHYAGRVWHDSDKGSWQLYGHSHADLPEIDPLLAFDVGVDANNYFPVSLDEVKKKMEGKIKRIQKSLGLSSKG